MTGERGSGQSNGNSPPQVARVQIIHLVPQTGIGGVEAAAASMAEIHTDRLDFLVRSIFGSSLPGFPVRLIDYIRAASGLLRSPPDLLIVSLWRAALVGILIKLLRRRVRLVLFLHSADDAHVLDRWANHLALWMCDWVWADSQTTLETRLQGRARARGSVISYRIANLPRVASANPRPNFIYWGRLHPIKQLDSAIRIFAGVRQACGTGQFVVIGPDSGAEAALREQVAAAGLNGCVQFRGPCDLTAITQEAAQASFFILTSKLEGMAAAVVEAMQLGLVPVVTPVGDIARYARDGENAVIVASEAQAIADVLVLLNSPERYQRLSDGASAEWSGMPTYRDSVLQACDRAMASTQAR